ncbi:MAG: amidohydrolase [Gammaproteobacteria bacterium]|nr:amidohydrolase [Gammaproteobacteria bacterium]
MAPEPADLVLLGGKVVTVDPSLGEARAIAIDGYRIEAVGDDAAVGAYIGPETKVIELHGRLVLPGFIEGHGHFLGLGRAREILDFTAASGWEEIVSQVAAAAAAAEPGDWIFGRGWHQEKWSSAPLPDVDGMPVNAGLNAIAANNPVYLTHASGHAALANDAALAAAGIGIDTPDPPGGTIVRGDDGRATGLLRENAQALVEDAIGRHEARLDKAALEAVARRRVRLAGEEALRFGITSFQDAGASFATIDLLRRLESEGSLPVRLYVMVQRESNEALAGRLPDYLMQPEGNDFLTVRSIKRQIDGALGAHGAWLLAPYADLPDSTGLVLETVAAIETAARIALAAGFQVNTHAIGDRANREVLDLYERVWREAGVSGADLRWRIEHAQHIHPGDIPRFGHLGVIAAVQGIHCTSDGPWIPARLGDVRAEQTSYRWRDLLDAGAVLNNGTDTPVEPIDPIASFYALVSRKMKSGEPFHPGQAMTRMEALKSYTLGNAYSAFEEHLKGSITPGKYADIIVLSKDILTIAEDEIPTTQVDYTIVGGEVRFIRTKPERRSEMRREVNALDVPGTRNGLTYASCESGTRRAGTRTRKDQNTAGRE